MSEFLTAAMENFSHPVLEDDYDALLVTIYYLKEIRDRQFEIEDMFDPIQGTIIHKFKVNRILNYNNGLY